MPIASRLMVSFALLLSTSVQAQNPVKQELEFNALFVNSADGQAKAENTTHILSDSTRIRSGGSAPGILRYSLAKDDWYFTGEFYNIFLASGIWGGISLYKNGWGLNSEFSFDHGKSAYSIQDKNVPVSSSSGGGDLPSTSMAFGPSYLLQTNNFRMETAIRYILQKGASSPFLNGYYSDLRLTGYNLKIKLAQFHSFTDTVALGMALDFQYLSSAKATVSEDYGSVSWELEVEDISYVSTTVYPIRLQLKF
jgi:hypothetical protein